MTPTGPRGIGEEHLHRLGGSSLDPRGTGDDQRMGASRKLLFEDEEGQTPEMITVEVGDEDRVDVVRRDPIPLHGDERGRTAVDQTRA